MIRLKEIVPYQKSDTVAKRLQQTAFPTISPETFGVEFEYYPGPTEDDFDPSDYEDEIIENMIGGHQWRRNHDSYLDWLQGKREYDNRRMYRGLWDDSHGPIDPDTWEQNNPFPSRYDYDSDTDGGQDEFDDAVTNWEEEKSDVEYNHRKWERHDIDGYAEEWAAEMIRDGEWQRYSDLTVSDLSGKTNTQTEIDEAVWFINDSLGDQVAGEDSSKDKWGVGMDGPNVEIRSKHLTESELPKIDTMLKKFLAYKKTSGNTSAHVHVGLPAKFDAFDIIAMSDLVDEKEIKDAIGSNRDYESWAKLNYDLAGDLLKGIGEFFKNAGKSITGRPLLEVDDGTIEQIETGWVIKLETLEKILKGKMSKYRGTNLAAFWDHRTIEFRYWSSEAAVKRPQTFINWIRYFLVLPKVAHKRNRVVIGPGRIGALVCSREGASHVRIELEDKFKEAVLKKWQRRLSDRNQMELPFR